MLVVLVSCRENLGGHGSESRDSDRAVRSERRVSADMRGVSVATPAPPEKQGLKNRANRVIPFRWHGTVLAPVSSLPMMLETVFMRLGLAWFGAVRPQCPAVGKAGVACGSGQ